MNDCCCDEMWSAVRDDLIYQNDGYYLYDAHNEPARRILVCPFCGAELDWE